jgi:hypothetical protein
MRQLTIAVAAVLAVAAAACADRGVTAGLASDPWIEVEDATRYATAHHLDLDRRLDARHVMLAPLRVGKAVVVPIAAEAPRAERYLTLDDGIERGLVTVRELDETNYNRLVIHNDSSRPLFVMSGEMVIGGVQDRSIAQSLAIAPHSEQEVPVFCVELGRASGDSREHAGARAMGHPSLRAAIHAGVQRGVWDEVAAHNLRRGVTNTSASYRKTLERSGAQAWWRDWLVSDVRALPDHDRIVGLALVLDGKVVAVDVLATPALYRAFEPKLIASYVEQAVDAPIEVRVPPPSAIREAFQTPVEATPVVTIALPTT